MYNASEDIGENFQNVHSIHGSGHSEHNMMAMTVRSDNLLINRELSYHYCLRGVTVSVGLSHGGCGFESHVNQQRAG